MLIYFQNNRLLKKVFILKVRCTFLFLAFTFSGWSQPVGIDTSYILNLLKRANKTITSNTDSSFFYSNAALAYSLKLPYELGISKSYLALGSCYYVRDSLDKALNFLLKSLNLAHRFDDYSLRGSINNNIGLVYTAQGKYTLNPQKIDDAIGYLRQGLIDRIKAIDIHSINNKYSSLKTKDSSEIAGSYNNIGVAFDEIFYINDSIKYLDSAIKNYGAALAIKTSIRDSFSLPSTLNSLSKAYSDLAYSTDEKFYTKVAVDYSRKAYQILLRTGDPYKMAEVLLNMGGNFLDIEKYDSAIWCAHKSLSFAYNLGDDDIISYNYSLLDHAFAKEGKFDSAYLYVIKWITIHDTILNKVANQQIEEISRKYDLASLTSENTLLKHEAEREYFQKKIFIAVSIIAILCLIVLVYREYRFKIKTKTTGILVNGDLINREHSGSISKKLKARRISFWMRIISLSIITCLSIYIIFDSTSTKLVAVLTTLLILYELISLLLSSEFSAPN